MHGSIPPIARALPGGLALLLLAACGHSRHPSIEQGGTTPVTRPFGLIALPAPIPTTASTRATLKLDSTWARCHDGFVLGNDPASEVDRLAALCATATKMRKVDPPFTGTQSAASRPQTFRWKADAGHCYRAYGVGAPGIHNLDLLLVDSSGAVLGQDGNDGAVPVVLDAGAVCFKQDDEAAVVVSVGDGTGVFAVEVWGD